MYLESTRLRAARAAYAKTEKEWLTYSLKQKKAKINKYLEDLYNYTTDKDVLSNITSALVVIDELEDIELNDYLDKINLVAMEDNLKVINSIAEEERKMHEAAAMADKKL